MRDSDVAAFFARTIGSSFGKVSDAGELAPSPDGRRIAFTGTRWQAFHGRSQTVVAVVDVASGAISIADDPGTGQVGEHGAAWSPDGKTLAYLSDRADSGAADLHLVEDGGAVTRVALPGVGEQLAWSPGGSAVAVLVAGRGAELAGIQGSGRTPRADAGDLWRPMVDTGTEESMWRRVHIYDTATGELRRVGPQWLNVWELTWAGPEHLAAVTTPAPDEGAWYEARLTLLSVTGATAREIYRPRQQIGMPTGSPDGLHVALVEGLASDRAVVMGSLVLVNTDTGAATTADVGDVDVSHCAWRSPHRLVAAGHAGAATAVVEIDIVTGHREVRWATDATCGGRVYPAAWPIGDDADVTLVRESATQPPAIVVTGAGERVVADLAHVGSAVLLEGLGSNRSLTWQAPDGRSVHGRLTLPAGAGPHPLLVHVHGGPVWTSRNTWIGRMMFLPLALSRGYAVLQPNPRGSSGWGHEFRDLVLGDMGGADVDDILTGIDAAVAAEPIDTGRIGVTGGSYGGYMTYVLITRESRFRAAAAVCPVSDYYAAQWTCNIPEFISRFLDADPEEVDGRYRSRSPLHEAMKVTTPTLHVVGAKDRCAPPTQGEMFHRAMLSYRRAPSTYVEYPDEGHGVQTFPAVFDYLSRLIGWFDQHLAAAS